MATIASGAAGRTTPGGRRAGTPSSYRHPAPWSLALRQVGHCLVSLWRSRVAMVFTFLFPLTWLVVVGFLTGNDPVAAGTGVRVMQFVAPTAAAMGVLYGTLPTVATAVAADRETGVLKRVRGTPLPAWGYLAGRIGAALVMAFGSLLMMLLVGVLAYDVQIIGRTVLAGVVTVLFATASFAAIGLAIAGLVRSAGLAQSGAVAAAVMIGFLSDMFTVDGELTGGVARFASLFPVQHLIHALKDQFDPFAAGPGWHPTGLLVMATWAVAAGVVAAWTFRRADERPRTPESARRTGPPVHPALRRTPGLGTVETGRPTVPALLWQQVRWRNTAVWRDLGSVFFAVAMPVALFAFVSWINQGSDLVDGVSVPLSMAAGMMAWGAAVTGFVNMPESVLRAQERGVLKRSRGTPLPPWVQLGGHVVSVLWLSFVTAALVGAVGVIWYDLEVAWSGVPAALVVLVLGALTLAACGLALASVLPDARSTTAVGLGVLLPLAFFSDVFWTGGLPAWMSTVGSFMPLKHVANGISSALDPTGPSVSWVGLAVLSAWFLLGALVAARRFRWSRASA